MEGIVEQVNGESSRRLVVIEYNIERDLPLMAAVSNVTSLLRTNCGKRWKLRRLNGRGVPLIGGFKGLRKLVS
jgi:hypothetical protein